MFTWYPEETALAAIRAIIVLSLAFSHSIFADWGPAPKKKIEPYVQVEKDTNKAGMVRTIINNYGEWGNNSYLTMVHDRKGDLKYFAYDIMRGNLIALEVYNGAVSTVMRSNLITLEVYNDTVSTAMRGKTHCDIAVVEPSGDTAFFNLKYEMIPKECPDVKADRDFLNSKIPARHKYDKIFHNRFYNDCQYDKGFR
jgi:hypothetical protein